MGNNASRPPRPQHEGPASGPAAGHTGPIMLRSSYRNQGDMYGAAFNRPYYPQAPPAAQAPPASDKVLTAAQTIQNPINVKKSSVKLTPVPGAPHKLAVSFTFDASQDCILNAFWMVTEESDEGCKLSPQKQAAQPAHAYSKGLALQYPKAGCEGVVLDTSLYSQADLLGANNILQYPLVIRGEAIAKSAAAEGHSLTSLDPGGAQRVWMQSQTTYAKLQKDETGAWQVQIIKQKIWALGTSYELQEIYGMDQAAAAAKEKGGVAVGRPAESDDERMCVICLSIERDTTVLPCRHMCMCHECAQELRKQTSKCPICRNTVESLLHIRMSRQQVPKSVQTPVDQSTVTAALEKMGLAGKSNSAAVPVRY